MAARWQHRWGVEERLAEVAGGEEELPAAAGARAGLCGRLLARARAVEGAGGGGRGRMRGRRRAQGRALVRARARGGRRKG